MELVWVALRNAGLAYEDKALGKGRFPAFLQTLARNVI